MVFALIAGGHLVSWYVLCLFQFIMLKVTGIAVAFVVLAAVVQAAPDSLPWLRLNAAKPSSHRSTDDILRFEPMTPLDEIWASFKQEHGLYFS
jgi:hypothetical protein